MAPLGHNEYNVFRESIFGNTFLQTSQKFAIINANTMYVDMFVYPKHNVATVSVTVVQGPMSQLILSSVWKWSKPHFMNLC